MSVLVVDTSALVQHLRGDERTTAFLERELEQGSILVPTLVAWELWKGARTPRLKQGIYAMLQSMVEDPFMPAMAQLAGELHRHHVERGIKRPTFDLLIASHALHHGAPLATFDRDYDSIEGLQVIRPGAP